MRSHEVYGLHFRCNEEADVQDIVVERTISVLALVAFFEFHSMNFWPDIPAELSIVMEIFGILVNLNRILLLATNSG